MESFSKRGQLGGMVELDGKSHIYAWVQKWQMSKNNWCNARKDKRGQENTHIESSSAEKVGINNGQWGSRAARTHTEPVMRKCSYLSMEDTWK